MNSCSPQRALGLERDLGILGTQVGGEAKGIVKTIQGVRGERRVPVTVLEDS